VGVHMTQFCSQFITLCRYVEEKNLLRAQLDAEKREEAALIRSLNDKGQLIIKMKTSLQQINQLLSSVGESCAQLHLLFNFVLLYDVLILITCHTKVTENFS
jgi:hypothetical protein